MALPNQLKATAAAAIVWGCAVGAVFAQPTGRPGDLFTTQGRSGSANIGARGHRPAHSVAPFPSEISEAEPETASGDGVAPPAENHGELGRPEKVAALILAVLFLVQLVSLFVLWLTHRRTGAIGTLEPLNEALDRSKGLEQWRGRATLSDVTAHLLDRTTALETENRNLATSIERLRIDAQSVRGNYAPTPERRPQIPDASVVREGPRRPEASPYVETAGQRQPTLSRSSLADVEEGFRAVLPSKSRSRLREFMNAHGAIGISPGLAGGGPLRIDPGASEPYLRAIELDGDLLALLPGDDIVVSFSTMFCTERSMPNEVTEAFDYEVDGSRNLTLLAASLWQKDQAGGLVLRRKGRIGGMTN